MPGVHLNRLETDLKKMWENGNAFDGSLRSISIGAEKSLRGIKDFTIEFRYPVTVICGKNGSGKTTLLSLSALAYNGCAGYFPKNSKTTKEADRGYYTFHHFFYKGPQDVDWTGVTIDWCIKNGDKTETISLKKQSNRWMRYERRPDRGVLYVGTTRVVSAVERNVLKSHFKPSNDLKKIRLNSDSASYLRDILGARYTSAQTLKHKEYSIRSCERSDISYSSFNMGAGEDIIIELLYDIQELPDNSLCVIEEIEMCIHPEALSRLAEVLKEIAKKRQIQFIISSHSSSFIDSLPRCARVLIERNNNETLPRYCPSTRYAMGSMGGHLMPELTIICEDELAKRIIERILPNKIRKRVNIVPTGSQTELVKAYDYSRRTSDGNFKGIIIWDGDVAEKDIAGYFKGIHNAEEISYAKLHQSGSPESNILNSLLRGGIDQLTSEFALESQSETKAILEKVQASGDLHNLSYIVHGMTNLERDDIMSTCVRIAVKLDEKDYDHIREKVSTLLEAK